MEITLTRSEEKQIINFVNEFVNYISKGFPTYKEVTYSIGFMDITIGVTIQKKEPIDENEDGEINVNVKCAFYVRDNLLFKLSEYICAGFWNELKNDVEIYVSETFDPEQKYLVHCNVIS